ncbi:hypothetical protein Q1695_008929 [Nippostrongylus brasiliensis]|nr:hypothetical protein Q1695_008929 [Nippostrongylus brasiliensis]
MMASRSNSLLTLRLLVIVATLIFLRKLYYEIQWEFNEGANEGPRSTPIDWRSIDIEKPSLTNNTVYERLRLNEFLAVPQYKCNDSLQLGDALESFTVCKENGPFENVLVITGNSLSSGKFERDLEVEGASKWTIFLPESSDLVNQLKGKLEICDCHGPLGISSSSRRR